ncbi:TerD family protein, partial [Kitasatospora sp. NPDC057198]|uniref:TerD family protein n=1 Tax=Kitasatospora sp. NPDC057198 TaxID=3346046 RepID=UPI0036381A0C
MSTALAKGGNVPVIRDGKGPATVVVGLGWQAADAYDLDANALLCDEDGKALSDGHFVFFNNLTSPDGAVTHLGAPGDGTDREQLAVDLLDVEEAVRRIVFTVAVYQADERRQSFGSVTGAYVRLTDPAGAELARYELGPE